MRPLRLVSVFEAICDEPCLAIVTTSSETYSTQAKCPKCGRLLDFHEWRTSYEQGLSA